MKDRVAKPANSAGPRRRRVAALALLALSAHTGCGREFFREWANQDVSEAVFEKSRDPRWRLDVFSVEPPAQSRFADPYDKDRPPAPPDDFPSQALSPVPQWPDHRLTMPVEGTGYLKLLDEGEHYKSPPPVAVPESSVTPRMLVRPGTGSQPPAANGASPFRPGRDGDPTDPNPTPPPPDSIPNGNSPPGANPANGLDASPRISGTNASKLSPTSLVKTDAPQAPAPLPVLSSLASPVGAARSTSDGGVRRVSLQQDPAQPMPTQTVPISPLTPPPSSTTSTGELLQTPPVSQDPLPRDLPLNVRTPPPPGESEQQRRQAIEESSTLQKLFVPQNVPFDEAIAAGLPANSSPPILTMEKAFQIALINARVYQYQLENIYINALPVTLQRFSFQPQFIAGLAPITTAAGGAGSLVPGSGLGAVQQPVNSFLYNTRETGTQLSALNLGTVAGVGKLFDNGTRVLASFANSVVFNFLGKNPAQPTVRSFLPIQAVVPFLRGGGRAITLEGLTQAERSLLYSIRSFAKFRQEFIVTTLTGGSIAQFGTSTTTGGFSAGSGNSDPATGFLNVVEDVQQVENFAKNLAVFERFLEVYKELLQGESFGLSDLQLQQINQSVQTARLNLINSQVTYRNDLDSYKIQLGMPPDTPLVIDRSRTLGLKQVFDRIDRWASSPRHEVADLEAIVASLPKLENIVIDGRSCQAIFSERDDPHLENLLLIAERVALENRLDLMNARAQLYDTWRQIRVSANALKGVLNVSVTNQILTPPTTNNPFGFLDQAKNFSLVFNAELPLIRVAERNNFATQLINYQRQRRTLQNAEDFLKYQLRSEIRQLQVFYKQYAIQARNLVITISQKDQAFEQIIAPPASSNANVNAATQTINLISAQNGVVQVENSLVTTWYNYQLQRLQVYRDLGILPYDEWEAFDELFPPDRSGRSSEAVPDRGRTPAAGGVRGTNPGPARSPAGLGTPIPVDRPAAAANPGTR